MHVYTFGSQPAQYVGGTGMPMFFGPWGSIVQGNGEGNYVVINGVKYPVIPYPYSIYSYF